MYLVNNMQEENFVFLMPNNDHSRLIKRGQGWKFIISINCPQFPLYNSAEDYRRVCQWAARNPLRATAHSHYHQPTPKKQLTKNL
jgi:hypothetical protein